MNTGTHQTPPSVLLLDGESIRDTSSACLYRISRSVTTLRTTTKKLLYNVRTTHPADAQYRTDIPAYYITCVDPETLGNIHIETSKPRLQKTEFTAILSRDRTASHKPLFNEPGQLSTLFTARPTSWRSSHYAWTDSEGNQVAVEDTDGEYRKLAISMPMPQETRDALVAVWLLRLWYETAESKQAKREGSLDRLPIVLKVS
ncbi:hypothetical protein BJX70DRAFT_391905 [Aspergillus crustosus]